MFERNTLAATVLALAAVAAVPLPARAAPDADLLKLGQTTYMQTCVACHLPDGKGIDKVNPPLAASDWVTGDADRIIRVALHGLQGAVTVNAQPYFGLMPGHAPMLNDEQIAAVLTFVRASWGNAAPAVDPQRVAFIRRAYPGQTTPWTADELKASVPDAAVGPDGVAAAAPLLRGLTYRYYEGQWAQLPDFAKLTPVATGELPDGLITIKPAKRGDRFGMVFNATLSVPAAGDYTFSLTSDDGSRLIIDGRVVIDHDGLHSPSAKAGVAKLTAGEHAFEVQYFEGTIGQTLELAISGPGIGTRTLSAGSVAQTKNDPAFFLLASDRPLVVRANMPDASSRAIAVGLLNGINYIFDPETCTVRYAWFGGFLDVGDNRGRGSGRGGANCKPLGERFDVGDSGHALAVATGSQAPDVRFLGYTRRSDAPTFRYQTGGVTVSQTVRGATGGLGLEYTFELDKTPDGPITFAVEPDGLTLAASAGAWSNGVLSVPAAAAKKFTVTLLVDRK